ncbi:MAG: GNAT family N-acetyltransferase [Pseudomonadota bacterium]|nr:GNAT family N-acetyltransferase [Pseudomonadota bacterium]
MRNLYNDLPEKLAIYPEDYTKETKHFVLYVDDNLISALTLIKKKIKPSDPESCQIRGMGTIKEFCGRGYASILINYLSKNLKKKKVKIIWCNSRISAINFYKKNKFEEVGLSFEIKSIGAHQKVLRYL